MDTVAIGPLAASPLGLGCLGMSEHYGPTDWDAALATIDRALELGLNFLDTADVYGSGHSEVLVGRAIAGRRDEFVVATKFGNDRLGQGIGHGRGDRAFALRSCDGSLTRLGVDTIDLYYLHRPPDNVPIEESVGAMAELVAAGKVRALGLSNVTAEQVERAHAVHPIAAVQNQYSLWHRDAEALGPTLARHGIALVPYSPLARGLLTGRWSADDLAPGDLRRKAVPADPAARERADDLARRVGDLAAALGATRAQVTLAWTRAQSASFGVPVVPIPGTKSVRYLEENAAALDLTLTGDQLASLTPEVVS
jgi:aryl-alcohol dehydrogenase-like predicted oxidoreductase